MFSVSDIKEDVYPAVYRRGKELYETGGVLDFAYDIYLEHDLPVAEVRAEVRGREQGSYRVTVVVDEEYGSVSSSNCTCEAFYNYEGMCKHCVAALLAYVNRRQAKDILAAHRTWGGRAGKRRGGEACRPDADDGSVQDAFEPVFTACRRELSDSGERLWKGGTGALF